MTERALPPVSVGTRRPFAPSALPPTPAARVTADRDDRTGTANPAANPATRPAARAGVRRGEAILTTPARAGMLIGASAALYAVSLAGVSTLQARTDARTIEARAPYVDQVAGLRAENDRLEQVLRDVDTSARALAADYAATGSRLADYEARLDALSALVADVQGSAAALPTRIKLPSVTMRGAVGTSRSGSTSRPRTTATSGASGG